MDDDDVPNVRQKAMPHARDEDLLYPQVDIVIKGKAVEAGGWNVNRWIPGVFSEIEYQDEEESDEDDEGDIVYWSGETFTFNVTMSTTVDLFHGNDLDRGTCREILRSWPWDDAHITSIDVVYGLESDMERLSPNLSKDEVVFRKGRESINPRRTFNQVQNATHVLNMQIPPSHALPTAIAQHIASFLVPPAAGITTVERHQLAGSTKRPRVEGRAVTTVPW